MSQGVKFRLPLSIAGAVLAVLLSSFIQQPSEAFVEAVSKRHQLEVRFVPHSISTKSLQFSNTTSARGCLVSNPNTCGIFILKSSRVNVGATYECLAQLSPSRFAGMGSFQAECKALTRIAPESKSVAVMTKVKRAFMANTRGLDVDSAALVSGLAIGDDSALSAQALSDLRAVSLTHLSAVSGTNCAILVALVFWIAGRFRFSRAAKFGSAVIFLVAYALLVGPQPSVIRAGVMALAVLLAKTIGRRVSPLRALGSAVVLILIVSPAAIFDVGFQLSVVATLGLLVLAPLVYEKLRLRIPRFLAAAIAVAFAAQLFCLPIVLQMQPNLPIYSIPANVLAEPVVPVVTVLGMLACIAAPVFPFATQVLTYLASFATAWILNLATTFANMPGAGVQWPVGVLGVSVSLTLVALVFLWFRFPDKASWAKIPLAILTSLLVMMTSSSVVRSVAWLPASWDVVSCDVGQGDATVIRSQGEVAVIDVGRYPDKIDRCLKRLGVSKVDLIVLTHFDQDHIGGLSGALKSRQVLTGMVSSASDIRFGANQSRELLTNATDDVIDAERGQTGSLGDLTWQVLNPPRDGAGTEDFNDASVAMLFSGNNFDLLTLADLGERGQMRISENFGVWSRRLHAPTSGGNRPLILKVAHHGSADFYPELYEALAADVALVSVGKENAYGHPTKRALDSLFRSHSLVFRTDLQGTIALDAADDARLRVSVSG